MSLAANAPRSFALVDLDSGCALERSRFKDATAAAMKAIKMRKQDGRVREVVGIDAAGHPCRIEIGMSVHDSAIAECKRTFAPWLCAYMKHTMESQGWGDVPIVVDAEAGPSWGDLSKMDVWLADFFGLPKGCKLEVGLGPRVRVTRLDGTKTEWLTGAAAETHDGFNEAVRGILNELGVGETR